MADLIALDARPLSDPTGEAFTYTLNLVHSLAFVADNLRLHLFFDRDPDPHVLPQSKKVTASRLDAPSRLWKSSALPSAAEKVGAKLIHVQGLLPVGGKLPVVTTIRHLEPLTLPEHYPRLVVWSWNSLLPRQLPAAARVLVPWESVRDRLVEHCPEVEGKLVVLPYGVEPMFAPQCESVVKYAVDRVGVAPDFVVGRIDPRLGPAPVVEVWELAREQGLTAQLVLDNATGTDLPGLNGMDVKAWPAILSGAVATILGGTSERLAHLLLESMACGTPAVGPDCAIFRELAGNVAVLGDSSAQATGLVQIATDEELRAARLRGSLTRAQQRTWPAMAEQLIGIYREVLG